MPAITGTLIPPKLAAAPSSPTAGQLYYDTGTSTLYFYNGTTWVACGSSGGTPTPAGVIQAYAGDTAPSGYLLCDGTAVSRTTYAALFAVLVTTVNTFTVTLATPGVFTTPAVHNLVVGDTVYFETTGALPTGLTADQGYVVTAVPTTTTFRVSASETIVAGVSTPGGDVATSGTQSGTHTCYRAPYARLGASAFGATTFNVPDLRGQIPVGKNAGTFAAMGLQAGEETHALVIAELAVHTHTFTGSALAGHTHTFTGTAMSAHTHSDSAGTPAGTVSSHTHSSFSATPGVRYAGTYVTTGGTIGVNNVGETTGGSSASTANPTTGATTPTFTGSAMAAHSHVDSAGTPAGTNASVSAGTPAGTNANTGSGTGHQNLQPYSVTNYIIKT